MHTHWGGRVNRPYALALDGAWEDRFGQKLDIYVANDCIVLQLPHRIAGEELWNMVGSENFESHLQKRLESSGFFGARFRECAGRALLVTRHRRNQRLPPWINRLRSQKLYEAVRRFDDFPILVADWLSYYGPRERVKVEATLGLEDPQYAWVWDELVQSGRVVMGSLTNESTEVEICDAENFTILIRWSRREAIPVFEPLPLNRLIAFQAQIQGLINRRDSIEGLFEIIDQLSCLPAPALLWEEEILPARMNGYLTSWIDSLMLEGDLRWVGTGKEKTAFCFDADIDLLLEEKDKDEMDENDGKEGVVSNESPGLPPVSEFPLIENDRRVTFAERVRILLERYGILFRERLNRESPLFSWSQLFRSIRLMEQSGEIIRHLLERPFRPLTRVFVEKINGKPAHGSLYEAVFRTLFNTSVEPRGISLFRHRG